MLKMMELQDRIDKIMEGLPPLLSSLKMSQDPHKLNYLQHLPQDVDNVQNKFIELINEILNTSYIVKKEDKYEIGRVLNDFGNIELYKGWYRFMSIDDQYREWTKPVFAISMNGMELNETDKFFCVNNDNPKVISYFRDKKLEEVLVESELQKSVRRLINVKSDRKKLIDFAKARYDEKFPCQKFGQNWHYYDNFIIIDENTISVEYKYGTGEYEYSASFNVDLTPYYRDEKLEILSRL
jgi:hypothetical protein